MNRVLLFACVVLGMRAGAVIAEDEVKPLSDDAIKAIKEVRTARDADQLEAWLRSFLVDEYPERAAKLWRYDYASVEAYIASVEPNRRRWRGRLNPPALSPTGPLQRRDYVPLEDLHAEWVTLPLGTFNAEGILVLPARAEQGPVPLVIAGHGLSGFPEVLFGLAQNEYYHGYARSLVEAGFAVLAPANVCTAERRNRLERMCRLGDMTLSGIEFARFQKLLDVVLKDSRIDGERVGMWGLSLGGRATMYWTPLEPRIKAAVVTAWFNRRPEKMVVESDRYSCFLSTHEEHAFLQGWLTEFSDPEAISLICPRPIMIQTGKRDPISHWPDVVEEFEKARVHYEKLGLKDRIQMVLHEGRHEAEVEAGVGFLRRWLMPSQQ